MKRALVLRFRELPGRPRPLSAGELAGVFGGEGCLASGSSCNPAAAKSNCCAGLTCRYNQFDRCYECLGY
jgi:hypothetical protein